MCDRKDNINTTGLKPEDTVDPTLREKTVTRLMPILLNRHGACIPSAECIFDAMSRENDE